jgi:hypothetical protein
LTEDKAGLAPAFFFFCPVLFSAREPLFPLPADVDRFNPPG